MKISLIQMNAGEDKAANLAKAETLIATAVARDAPDLVALPEMFFYHGLSAEGRRAAAEPIDGPTATFLRETARAHGVFVHGGSFIERAGDSLYNTTLAFDRTGKRLARYRKIHLFDVTTPDGRQFRESEVFSRGDEIVAYAAQGFSIGCSICYDLRFPELYQRLARAGAEVIMVPSAFTLLTGRDHWQVLLRARAIETECFVCAPAQWGPYPDGRGASYGHSMIVDPWGKAIAEIAEGEGFASAMLERSFQETVRARIPLADHKVL